MTLDEYLLAALRLGAGHDSVPDHVAAAAKEAYALRVPDAEIAYPVACDATRAVRGDDGQRLVRFAAPGLTVDVEVSVDDGLIDLAGQVTPPLGLGGHVDVRTMQLTLRREVAPDGHFTATGLPPGWFSLKCHRPGEAPVVTAWIRIRA
ncbi:hypothetical protein [Thermoactinospora rubra]|uniref:hypothetical protein n=1 Tax=Thermoactinospora rubra TaxID=1088767 RepID=UPI000A0F80F4|nr:hypothetical protein [Thermoactinospora rubra]